jgi:hypothetical protein
VDRLVTGVEGGHEIPVGHGWLWAAVLCLAMSSVRWVWLWHLLCCLRMWMIFLVGPFPGDILVKANFCGFAHNCWYSGTATPIDVYIQEWRMISRSFINLMFGWMMIRWQRKMLSSCGLCSQMMKVLSKYLNQQLGFFKASVHALKCCIYMYNCLLWQRTEVTP